ncbi:hypothetical protein GE061_006496 [Apolygus lucorum]|uniref:Uncharacterized protein n=1 Tax=Apolygus lucorum TaxID=248454 RepID=A0A6A4J7K2_APOLU|nr:hypothetical protein GE061_006496 [Apolygus lucorum]
MTEKGHVMEAKIRPIELFYKNFVSELDKVLVFAEQIWPSSSEILKDFEVGQFGVTWRKLKESYWDDLAPKQKLRMTEKGHVMEAKIRPIELFYKNFVSELDKVLVFAEQIWPSSSEILKDFEVGQFGVTWRKLKESYWDDLAPKQKLRMTEKGHVMESKIGPIELFNENLWLLQCKFGLQVRRY